VIKTEISFDFLLIFDMLYCHVKASLQRQYKQARYRSGSV